MKSIHVQFYTANATTSDLGLNKKELIVRILCCPGQRCVFGRCDLHINTPQFDFLSRSTPA